MKNRLSRLTMVCLAIAATAGVARRTDGAESPYMVSLKINGPNYVLDSAQATYTATATYSNGTKQQVTATWRVTSAVGTISNGAFVPKNVTGDQTGTIVAYVPTKRLPVTGTKSITVLDAPTQGSHLSRLSQFVPYEGTKTCLNCHPDKALEVHASAHYQWKGATPNLVNWNGGDAGKLGGINDFCIYPDINWIGKLTNVDGVKVDGGCAKCHAGLGDKPTPEVSQSQLENIDCLVCHNAAYRRKVEQVGGKYKYVPDTAAMGKTALQAAVDLSQPGRDACLNCHSKSGGGDNYKRGDLEEAHRNPTASFDFHMGGQNMKCTDCHVTVNHRIAGRGSDLRQNDSTNSVSCTNCHSSTPHTNTANKTTLDNHTKRLNCTVCHIPTFAKVAATDMRRDWQLPGELDVAKRLYDPHMIQQANVMPAYRFWNGKSTMYQFGTPALAGASGKVVMSEPVGSIQEQGAKIHAFKHHTGVQPIETASTKRLLPLKIGIFFESNNLQRAVEEGAKGVGWGYTGHDFIETERYLGLFHEVAPRGQAVSCANCHYNARMNFDALGYTPKTTRDGKALCISCHEDKTDEDWVIPGTYNYFRRLHSYHVTQFRKNCSECHDFSKAL